MTARDETAAVPPIAEWGAANVVAWPTQSDGRRNVKIEWPAVGLSVMVTDTPSRTDGVVDAIAMAPSVAIQLGAARKRVAALQQQIDSMPPREPERIFGTGCVREDRTGRGLWLLSSSEKGWSAFGFRLDGWDDLFRRFDVVIGAPRADENGQWWPAEPRSRGTR